MGINTAYARTAFLLIATLTYAAEKRDWKQGTLLDWKLGTLISVDTITPSDKGERRFEYVVSDGTFSYTMEYEHPIKAPCSPSDKIRD